MDPCSRTASLGGFAAAASARLLLVAALLPCACAPSGLAPVGHYPFVEDRSLRLAHETLTLRVERGSVEVEALFRFVGPGASKARTMTFPVGGPESPAKAFRAEIGADRRPIPVAIGQSGPLPMGEARESWDLFFDEGSLAAHAGVLRVRYEQAAEREFRYVLKSGAYWDGPIAELVVVVEDPQRRVAELVVEDRVRAPGGEPRFSFRMLDIEPRSGVKMVLR